MSELQAAMGLAVLPYLDTIIEERKRVCDYYDQHLDFNKVTKLKLREGTQWNYAYYPVMFESEADLLKSKKQLESDNIFPRRYFYPSLDKLSYVTSNQCVVTSKISKRIMCLPLYVGIYNNHLDEIIFCINN